MRRWSPGSTNNWTRNQAEQWWDILLRCQEPTASTRLLSSHPLVPPLSNQLRSLLLINSTLHHRAQGDQPPTKDLLTGILQTTWVPHLRWPQVLTHLYLIPTWDLPTVSTLIRARLNLMPRPSKQLFHTKAQAPKSLRLQKLLVEMRTAV